MKHRRLRDVGNGYGIFRAYCFRLALPLRAAALAQAAVREPWEA